MADTTESSDPVASEDASQVPQPDQEVSTHPAEAAQRPPGAGVTVILWVMGAALYLATLWLGRDVEVGPRFSVSLVLFPLWGLALAGALTVILRAMHGRVDEWSGLRRFFAALGAIAALGLLGPAVYNGGLMPFGVALIADAVSPADMEWSWGPLLWFVLPGLVVAEAWIRRGSRLRPWRSMGWAAVVVGLASLALLPWAAQAWYLYGLSQPGLPR